MISLRTMLFTFLSAVLLTAVTEATPPQVAAGFGLGDGSVRSVRVEQPAAGVGLGFGHTASISDGTSNTIVTPGGFLLSRKAGGGPQEYIVVPESLPAPPFVSIPYPVSGAR